jgi:hypothetical protein
VLRLNEADAKALVRNVASSDQQRALTDKIKQMERFKALYFCEGVSGCATGVSACLPIVLCVDRGRSQFLRG